MRERKVGEAAASGSKKCYYNRKNGATNLEAVLVGLQNGVDLRGCEDVTAEDWGCVVAFKVAILPQPKGPSGGGLVRTPSRLALVLFVR